MTAQVGIDQTVSLGRTDIWQHPLLALVGLVVSILLLFSRDAVQMVEIWLTSSTFNHCLLILPIIAWLVWQRLPELRGLVPTIWTPGLLVVAAGAAGWLLGDAGGVALARHAGLVLMLQGTVVVCLGKAVARGLAFPLFYAVFLIPIGEEIVPLMQNVTAEICMALLALVGIPAHIEGIFISIPSGYFEVAEACSGVKFLVAMVAYGALVANVCFRSWPRRISFMAAAILIPILANGLRAWGTIYVAHLTSIEFAVGFDHVLYGWIFFAIVIVLIMAAGWPFFDRGPGDRWFDPESLQPEVPAATSSRRLLQVTMAVLAIGSIPILWSMAIAATSTPVAAGDVILPSVRGWERVRADRGRPWQPHFAGADALRLGRYRNQKGQEVDLAIAVFARQEEGRELVGFGQGAVAPGGAWAWTAAGKALPDARAERIASFGTIREVVTHYRVGTILTGSPLAVKLETMKMRLLGGPQRAVAILISSEAPAEGADPRPAIDAFLRDLGPISRLADRAAGMKAR
ncbi:exosortase A [Sphingosinicella rhizophila]|uniref:Exosortase A n=1 Tax=Sphingosinicella rhizophila TaxID=3050082 RepID=A0ABU3Q2W1_9SPHN|nr:exosortase A [Sphingosinicella sp. GR2756]MDT9597753.1 exosortase A [Sphingosinicella sp. GR2756]